MNYKNIYEALVNRGKLRELDTFCEKHHIIPRCMGGSDHKDNLVKLTPEEHYVAHQLLVKMYPNNLALIKAAAMMVPNRPSNKLYGWIKRKFAIAKSVEQTGTGNSQFGTKWVHNPISKENKKIKGDIEEGWLYGKYKPPKVKKLVDSSRSINRMKQIEIHRKYYEIYKEVGFEKFVEQTGYTKSKANLVQRFAKLLDDFVPQNGKKR